MSSFQILSDYEVARSIAAIEAVGRLGKPVAEVCDVAVIRLDELEDDLDTCLEQARQAGVMAYIRDHENGRATYGFFRYPWVLAALEFIDQHHQDLGQAKDWISGLLFGYEAGAIHAFVSSSVGSESRSRPSDAEGKEGSCPPCSEQSRSRSPTNSRFRIVGWARPCTEPV